MQLVQYILSQPLSAQDLHKMLGPHTSTTRIINYHELKNFRNLTELFKDHQAVIIFRDLHDPQVKTTVGHWTLVLDHPHYYEHFDSYGIGMDEELNITKEKQALLLGLFRHAEKPLVESGRKLQSRKEDVNTCGRWVIARTHLKNQTLDEFYKLIDLVNNVPDVAVTLMTMFL